MSISKKVLTDLAILCVARLKGSIYCMYQNPIRHEHKFAAKKVKSKDLLIEEMAPCPESKVK